MSASNGTYGDVSVTTGDDHVAIVEIHRPPHTFFSLAMLGSLADAFQAADEDPNARCIVLCAEGKNFCAGAELEPEDPRLTPANTSSNPGSRHIYDEAYRLFNTAIPSVAAVGGAAIGGGLGLACMADFRIGGPGTRMSANFARLGFHHGFGLTETLPAIVGQQKALELLYTGRRIKGDTAFDIGLLDYIVDDDQVRQRAQELAQEIAESAPLAVNSIRTTMRGELPEKIQAATARERLEQERLTTTKDWAEGIAAMAERRSPTFTGR